MRRNRRLMHLVMLVLTILLTYVMLCGYTKAATYFGAASPGNFWSSEMATLDSDMDKIKEDGFNSIILVVPWRFFQPELNAASENTEAYAKLKTIMEAADKHGLKVWLRLGYTWDDYSDESPLGRYTSLYTDTTNQTRSCFIAYCKEVYICAASYGSYGGAFITWEDFWNNITDHEKTYDSLMAYDEWLNGLLLDVQTVVPDCSMEVRLDIDAVKTADGNDMGVAHAMTFPSGGASYTSCMYAAGMGTGGSVELDAGTGVIKLENTISNLYNSSGKPVFIDQFLYTDNTPGYEHVAKIAEADMSNYLLQSVPVLKTYTCGYGIWTYRDYTDDCVRNGEFASGTDKWNVSGTASVATGSTGNCVSMSRGGRMSQSLKPSFLTSGNVYVQFTYTDASDTQMSCALGSASQSARLSGSGVSEFKFSSLGSGSLELSCNSGSIKIDNVRVYSHITEGGVYTQKGEVGKYRDILRQVNADLEQ